MPKHGSISVALRPRKPEGSLLRTDSPGRPPRLSHSSWTDYECSADLVASTYSPNASRVDTTWSRNEGEKRRLIQSSVWKRWTYRLPRQCLRSLWAYSNISLLKKNWADWALTLRVSRNHWSKLSGAPKSQQRPRPPPESMKRSGPRTVQSIRGGGAGGIGGGRGVVGAGGGGRGGGGETSEPSTVVSSDE